MKKSKICNEYKFSLFYFAYSSETTLINNSDFYKLYCRHANTKTSVYLRFNEFDLLEDVKLEVRENS